VAAGVLLLDQATKWWVQQTMPERPPIEVLGDWLQITYTLNPGAAFSMGGSFTVILSAIAVGVSIVIVRVASRLGSVAWAVALGGILGGALGNLTDRILREPGPFRGHVVDWISVPNWPVFNVADSAIFCSAVLMVWLSFRGVGLDGTRVH
jgi:signal peptidase II